MNAQEKAQQTVCSTYNRDSFIRDVLMWLFPERVAVLSSPEKQRDITGTEQKVIKECVRYATITLDDLTTVSCYEILLQDTVRIEHNKVSIQQYVRKLLLGKEAALINFISQKNTGVWRLTLVYTKQVLGDAGVTEVKSNPKRYSFLVEKHKPNRTLVERFTEFAAKGAYTLEMLEHAFSVERMSKAFFDEYKKHYLDFVEYITGTRLVKEGGKWKEKSTGPRNESLYPLFGDDKKVRHFIKKMMGRIIFLYFVQKKGWLGASSTSYADGNTNFMMSLFTMLGKEEFYTNGLYPLFFEALNTQERTMSTRCPTAQR